MKKSKTSYPAIQATGNSPRAVLCAAARNIPGQEAFRPYIPHTVVIDSSESLSICQLTYDTTAILTSFQPIPSKFNTKQTIAHAAGCEVIIPKKTFVGIYPDGKQMRLLFCPDSPFESAIPVFSNSIRIHPEKQVPFHRAVGLAPVGLVVLLVDSDKKTSQFSLLDFSAIRTEILGQINISDAA